MKILQALKNGGLIRNYIFATISAGAVMGLLFLIVSLTLTANTIQNARQSSEVIFHQTEQQLDAFEESIDNLYTNLVYNTAITGYLQAETLEGRMDYLEEFRGIVASNRRINPNILTISLYSLEEELVASRGDVFLPAQDLSPDQTIRYSGVLSKDGKTYFQVVMQVYTRDGRQYRRIGSICLLLGTDELQSMLSSSLLNGESGVALLDGDGNLVVGAGIWGGGYTPQDDTGCIVQTREMEMSGWTLISRTPESSLVGSGSELHRIAYLIFGVALLVLFSLCFALYRHVIRPIYSQTKFMETFTEDTRQRIQVVERNEIGRMAQALNQMLDDMEELNQTVIRTECRNLELDYQKKQMEILAYKNQMNPHFLYNTLDCIRGMALYHQETEIARLVQSLSALFRYSIKGGEFVTVKEAAAQLERYRTIIEYRFMGKYGIVIAVQEDAASFRLPKMLVQPLVENAILHGLEESRTGREVRVSFAKRENGCGITVEDDGVGMSPETQRELLARMKAYDETGVSPEVAPGVGILNVYRRLRLFYGENAVFEMESEPGRGTVVSLFIPEREES